MKVGDDGTVSLREGERVNVEYIVSNHFVGETIEIKLLRNGKVCLSVLSSLVPDILIPNLVNSEYTDILILYVQNILYF